MEIDELLHTPINRLGFSTGFCKICASMNFTTLLDVTSISPEELINKEGFNYTWLGELSGYLDKKGLLHLLQRP
ncbi:hypothetical protein FFJ24_005665 [Pedobacter sp. KBS0701]|uniref:hypothetical protein n=1 Tax=Pedobacter sp. KBS0701 TaxID=2578106 RepID=UPI00110E4210|nr:hypothetical protein [Pedobacter sp. KBS0701]QDW24338.1 hypothetical protein FFJ24_005665 [Pedobacter sp. KBS0701]